MKRCNNDMSDHVAQFLIIETGQLPPPISCGVFSGWRQKPSILDENPVSSVFTPHKIWNHAPGLPVMHRPLRVFL